MEQKHGKLLLKSSECYNLIQLPRQRSTSRRSVSSVWVFSVASLRLPGGCGFTASAGAGPRVVPLILSCRDEDKDTSGAVSQQVVEDNQTYNVTYCNFHTSSPGPPRGRSRNTLCPCGQACGCQRHSESIALNLTHTHRKTHAAAGCCV